MKHLILIRHAKSSWSEFGLSDFERPLNGRGKRNAPIMGQRLAERDCSPDRLISSPAKRARKTAKIIAQEIDYPENRIEWCEEVYEASLSTLIQLVRSLDEGVDSVILIGHNPGFSSLGSWLCPASPDWLPTCGIVELQLDTDSWADAEANCGELLCYDYPKKII